MRRSLSTIAAIFAVLTLFAVMTLAQETPEPLLTETPAIIDIPNPIFTPFAPELIPVNTEAPSLTPTLPSPATLFPTMTLFPTLTAPPEQTIDSAFSLIYLESFTGETDPWEALSGGLGAPIFTGNGYSLSLYPGAPPTQITSGQYGDHSVQVVVQSGLEARLNVRTSEAGAYSVIVNGDVLQVLRGDVLLGDSVLSPTAYPWRLLNVTVVGGAITVRIDGADALSVTDSAPLPPGRVTITMPNGGLIDDLAISVPGESADGANSVITLPGTLVPLIYSFFNNTPEIRQALFSPDGSDAIINPGIRRWNYFGEANIRIVPGTHPYNISDAQMDISPDGNFIIESCRNLTTNIREICVTDVNQRVRFPVTSGVEFDQHPAWYQDESGVWIVYTSYPTAPNSFPEIRRIPFTGTTPNPIATPEKIADRCIDPVAELAGSTWYLFCTHYQIAGWEGVRMLAPVIDPVAQAQPLPIDGVTLNLGVRLIDAGWTGSQLRLATTTYLASGGANANVLRLSASPSVNLQTVRTYPGNMRNLARALSPDGAWLVVDWEDVYNFSDVTARRIDGGSNENYRIIPGPTFRYFEWWRQVPSVDLGLTLTLADGINPAALRVGDQVNVVAAITNRGTLASTNPITLTVRVPAGIVPARVQASSTIQSVFQGFFDWLIGTPPPDPAVQRVDNADGSVSFTYPFTVGSLAPGETDRFEFTLTVTGQQAGEFFIDGQAQTTFDQTSPSPDGPDGAAALTNVTTQGQLRLQFNLAPPPGAQVVCVTSQFASLNLRPRPENGIEQFRNFQFVTVSVYGWTQDGLLDDPNAWWLFVQVIDSSGIGRDFGWVNGVLFPNTPAPGQVCGSMSVPQFGYNLENGNPTLSLPPTATPTLTYTPSITPTRPSGTVTPSPTSNPLLVYKIRFSNELGTPASAWSAEEIAQIREAVRMVGLAFQIELGTASPEEAFNRVFVNGDQPEYVYFNRANVASGNITIQYLNGAPQITLTEQVDLGGCRTTNSLPRVITCNWSSTSRAPFPVSAIVHELGHVFTNRSRLSSSSNTLESQNGLLYAAVQGTYSGNCSPVFSQTGLFSLSVFRSQCIFIIDNGGASSLVMGRNFSNVWQRGGRGWGTVPNNQITRFQQHPLPPFPRDTDPIRVDETAADMFLNWVYRRVTNDPPTYRVSTMVPEAWDGFANIDSDGNFDSRFPGDARFEWMNTIMARIIAVKGW